jgi:hypothetical protein
MTVDELFGSLAQNKVALFLDGDRLRYRAPEGSLTPDMRAALGEHRAEIIRHLRASGNIEGGSEKCITCDRQHWIDAAPKDGRIRTTCGKCGHFIGYRPENLVKP